MAVAALLFAALDNNSGRIGDTFGIVNSLFSALAFGGAILAMYFQNKTLIEQQSQFQEQMKTQYLERFESTFFKLLERHEELKSKITISYSTASGLKINATGIQAIANGYQELLDFLLDGKPSLDEMVTNHRAFLMAYPQFRNYLFSLYDLHNYVINHEHLNNEQKEFYVRIVQRNIPQFELAMLYYYSTLTMNRRQSMDSIDIFRSLDITNLKNKLYDLTLYYDNF